MTLASTSAADFLASAPKPLNGSSPRASRLGMELKRIFHEHAARAPRTLQQHLGPSELGSPCDRQVAGKMAALPTTNHVSDPWPSIVGTACHAWAAEAFEGDNLRTGILRWVAEQKVTPHPDHPGTADLYDSVEQAVIDHKFLGESSLQKVRKAPPRHYVVQLILYGLGYIKMGLPVKYVALAAYPRTQATLDGLYVWDRDLTTDGWTLTPENLVLLETVFADTARRRKQADQLIAGSVQLTDIRATPDDSDCYFCPFYRPQAAHDGGSGCPGGRAGS